MECVKHPGTPVVSVCITCGSTLVCLDCITDKLHKGHVFEKPNKISNEIKTKLKPIEEDDCKIEARLESNLTRIRALETQQNGKQKERVKLINARRQVLIDAVNEMADTFISDYEKQTQKNRIKLKVAIDIVSNQLENVKRHREEVKRMLDEKDDLSVVKDSGNLKDVDLQIKPDPQLADINFTYGKVNTQYLKIMFGGTATEMNELHVATLQGAQVAADMALSLNKGSDFVGTLIHQDRELVLESRFKTSKSTHVSCMCTYANGKSWIRCYAGRELTLTDKHGHIEKTVTLDSGVIGMTTFENALLLCSVDDIKQVVLPSGNVTSVFPTGKLYPQHVCTAQDGDLYVTLTDTGNLNLTANSERVLVRYSPQGREKGRARYDKRGNSLFVLPFRVRISSIGDIIGVTNGTDKKNNHLVLLNTDLTLRLRYLGNGKVVSGDEKFDTTTYKPEQTYSIIDFIFDSFDDIIIAEAYSKCVQLLSKDCVPIRTLLPTQEYALTSLTLNGDEMWLGFKDGTIKVYKYK